MFGGSTSIVRFNHNTFSHTGGGYGLETSKAYAGYDNIVFTGTWSTWHVRTQNVTSEFTDSNFDLAKVDLKTSGNLVSRNHNDVSGSYHVLANTLQQSDITNKAVPADTHLYLESGTWELDENANFQTVTLTINSGDLEVTAENTWGTVTPANANSYPEIKAGAVLYWWNAVFNPLAIPREVNAGLVKYDTGGYYDIYGVVTESTVNVGWSVNDVTGTAGEVPVRLIGTQGAHCATYCQTKWVIDETVEMRNLTVGNNSKFDQVPNGGSSVYSRYDPAYGGVYVETGGLWSIVGTPSHNAFAERLSTLSFGIWNLTPQGCDPNALHVSLANI